MTNELQKAFESRASELGYSVRKDASGEYIYKPTGKLWRWYEAGAHSVIEYADPNFLMSGEGQSIASSCAGFNQVYKG